MDNDMAARRAERLTLSGREMLAEIQRAMEADYHGGIPAIVERMRELPSADQGEIKELIGLLRHGASTEMSYLDADIAAAEGAEHVLLAAQDKLQAEGKPVDPGMTVREAYEILHG